MPTISVRELCAFGAKRGDLDLRFTPAPTAEEGMAAHAAVAARRGADYQRELRIEHRHGDLLVRGRADGLNAVPLRLEEIKSHRGKLERMPAHHRELHWAQVRLYAVQLCINRELSELPTALVYYDVDRGRETTFQKVFSREELIAFSGELCEAYRLWDIDQRAHRARRDAALVRMAFPHADFREGQRRFAEAVYRGIRDRRPVMVQAPTGIGKSIGSLFPALKALSNGLIDKIYYLTAKTSGRRAALDALASLQSDDAPLPLRVLELVAREKCCEHPGSACHGQACPLAKGFFDRLSAARQDATQRHDLRQASLRAVALRHEVCPYFLAQEMVRWADVIVGDYNYYFDRSAILHSFMLANNWKVTVLVDEAHNLIDRGRSMYSAALTQKAIPPLRRLASTKIKPSLTAVTKAFRQMIASQAETYCAHAGPHQALTEALRGVIAKIGEALADDPDTVGPELQRFYFDAIGFVAIADEFDEHALYDVTIENASAIAAIRNVIPGRYFKARLAAAGHVVLFSATLNPAEYHRELLGLPADTCCLDVPSPFDPGQLRLTIDRISTRLADRNASLRRIASVVTQRFHSRPGNYLVFCSSFRYLHQLAQALSEESPELPILLQARDQSEAARAEFVERFRRGESVLGLAVLGSVFAEGIDLPGEQLIGAFVVTLGMPEPNPVNEAIRSRLELVFGAAAYDFTYLYPGIQRVVQAGGRVIRTVTDRGHLHLIDDRFARPAIQRLLPDPWQKAIAANT